MKILANKWQIGWLLLLATTVQADDGINHGNSAWVLTATALVLMMTLPGLALFYAGMCVRKISYQP